MDTELSRNTLEFRRKRGYNVVIRTAETYSETAASTAKNSKAHPCAISGAMKEQPVDVAMGKSTLFISTAQLHTQS